MIDLSAIKAAAAALQQQRQPSKSEPKRGAGSAKRVKPAPKTDTPKTEQGASYIIPAKFKQAIEGYLLGRGDITQKMARRDKSIDKCCEFIYSMMLKRAKKLQQGGSHIVGMSPPDSDVFGLAVHYYDEPNAELAKEVEDDDNG